MIKRVQAKAREERRRREREEQKKEREERREEPVAPRVPSQAPTGEAPAFMARWLGRSPAVVA